MTLRRAAIGAVLLAVLSAFGGVAAAAPPAARPAALQALLDDAAQALAQGDVLSALRGYETAAAQEHAADIELGIVLSLMRAGEYRRALAFAAHTAAAHADKPMGAAVHARLLDVAGLPAAPPRSAAPDGGDAADAALLMALPAPAALARLVGSGVLVDGGRRAVVPDDGLDRFTTLWLRDGRGRSARARVEQRDAQLGVALLGLEPALDGVPRLALPERDAFAGSPAHAAASVAATEVAAGWPRLRLGFLGGGEPQRLGVDLPPGPRGGPVFDAAGRLIGVTLGPRGQASADRLLPVSALRQRFGDVVGAPAATAPRVAVDQIYEVALRTSVQLFGAP